MTYWYKRRPTSSKDQLEDSWVHTRDYPPKELFEKYNDIKIWWHVNDETGEIDRNINMSDKDLRKAMTT